MADSAASSGNWVEQFGISEDDLSSLDRGDGYTRAEALRFCLMNGKINESDYLEWAMNAFELPALSGDFFTAAIDPVFWAHAKDLYDWNPGFFPLAEWQGVFLIACLEPPENFKFQFPHRFVLASARQLFLIWEQLNPRAEEPAEGQPPASETDYRAPGPPPPGPFTSITKSDTFDMPDGIVINDAIPPKLEETLTRSALGEFDAPTGLEVDEDAIAPPSSSPDGLVAAQNGAVPEMPVTPDGFVADHGMESDNDGATLTSAAQAAASAQSATPRTPEATGDATVLIPKQAPAAKAAPQTDARQSAAIEEEGRVEVTATNFTSAGMRPLASAHSLNSLGSLTLAHITEHFDAAMVLLADNATGALKPWKWSDTLTSVKNAELSGIDLNQPSAFRVVFRSKQPFHGQMPASDVNNAFASAFAGGRLPVITALPVILNRTFMGMIVGMSTKQRNYKHVLGPMADIADELAKQLGKLSKAEAA